MFSCDQERTSTVIFQATVDKWSCCSNEDLLTYYRSVLNTGATFCLATNTATATPTTPTTTTSSSSSSSSCSTAITKDCAG